MTKHVDSLSSLNIKSASKKTPEAQHVAVREPQRRPSQLSMIKQFKIVWPLNLTINQIYEATKDFSHSLRLGNEGRGTVYKGILPNGQVIAVKQVKKDKLLRGEFKLLSQIQHPNLVNVLGCTKEGDTFFIIMEYVSNGDLREHLDGLQGIILDFNQRLKIALDVAQALTYLHEEKIIHQNVGSLHIMLTEGYVAKVSSVGLARFGTATRYFKFLAKNPPNWYLDPEYRLTKQFTSKSDAFSFGVLLLEIVSGRRPTELYRPYDGVATIKWPLTEYKESRLRDILDPKLTEVVDEEALQKMLALAFDCAAPTSADRPPMTVVRDRLSEIMNDYGKSHGK